MERQGSGESIWPYAGGEECWRWGQHLEPSPWLQPAADAVGADAEAVVVVEVALVGQGKAHSAIFIVNPTTAAKKASETAYKIYVQRTVRQPQSQAFQSWKISDLGLCM